METTLQLILDELKTMNQRMDSMENRMGSMEQNLSDLTEQVKENTLFIHALINGQHKLEQKIDSSIDFMQNLAVRTTTLEHVTGKILYNLAD
ncbi:MAG: hypothetical protein IIU56_01970, partial [Peptococcaceae bacterium]|nr:hypothetical protein [Peptococcaceae bacterium]